MVAYAAAERLRCVGVGLLTWEQLWELGVELLIVHSV